MNRPIIHGKTYAEKQESLRQLAIDYQYRYSDGWEPSYDEVYEWTDFFRTNGRRYGLIEEFIENAII